MIDHVNCRMNERLFSNISTGCVLWPGGSIKCMMRRAALSERHAPLKNLTSAWLSKLICSTRNCLRCDSTQTWCKFKTWTWRRSLMSSSKQKSYSRPVSIDGLALNKSNIASNNKSARARDVSTNRSPQSDSKDLIKTVQIIAMASSNQWTAIWHKHIRVWTLIWVRQCATGGILQRTSLTLIRTGEAPPTPTQIWTNNEDSTCLLFRLNMGTNHASASLPSKLTHQPNFNRTNSTLCSLKRTTRSHPRHTPNKRFLRNHQRSKPPQKPLKMSQNLSLTNKHPQVKLQTRETNLTISDNYLYFYKIILL